MNEKGADLSIGALLVSDQRLSANQATTTGHYLFSVLSRNGLFVAVPV
jgi:hypothetical protein